MPPFPTQNVPEYCFPRNKRIIKLKFAIHSLLSTNLTFLVLHFSRMVKPCFEGKLEIHSMQLTKVRFCGKVSNFTHHVPDNKFSINLVYFGCVSYDIHFVLMVTDRHAFFTNFTLGNPLHHCLFSATKLTSLNTFFLVSKKTEHIEIAVPLQLNGNISCVDGPDLASRVISPCLPKVNLSTFQGIVQVLVTSYLEGDQTLFKVAAHPITFIHLCVKHDDLKDIEMPSSVCSLHLCSFYFETNVSLTINLTLTSLSYDGQKSRTCQFGGLFIYGEHFSNENTTICNRDYGVHPHLGRSFYSHNSSLIVLLYWYNHKAVIKAKCTVSVSQTVCKHTKVSSCSPQLPRLLQPQTTTKNGCSVYEVLNYMTDIHNWDCELTLNDAQHFDGYQSEFHTRGFIQYIPFRKSFVGFAFTQTQLLLTGQFDKLCLKTSKQNICHQGQRRVNISSDFYKAEPVRFSIFVVHKKCKHAPPTILRFRSTYTSDSWIEIKLRHKKILRTTEQFQIQHIRTSQVCLNSFLIVRTGKKKMV